jgi:hypothetical protein
MQLAPVLVTSKSAPAYNVVGRDDHLLQSSRENRPVIRVFVEQRWMARRQRAASAWSAGIPTREAAAREP